MADIKEKRADTQSQYTSFRVTVYRFDLPQTIVIGVLGPLSLNDILYMDATDSRYETITDFFNIPENLKALLKLMQTSIQSGIKSGLESSGGGLQPLFNNTGIFQQIDITPLVSAVSTHLGLNAINSCDITMVDSAFSDFGQGNIEATALMVPSLKAGQSRTNAMASKAIGESLRDFTMHEFDFIRVEGYSRIDESLPARMDGLANVGIDTRYTMTPMFTGYVSDITRNTAVGSVPSVSVNCNGVSRIFAQSVVVINKSIGQVLTDFDDSGVNLAVLNQQMNVLGNPFMQRTSDEVFQNIMHLYLAPTQIGSSGELGVADISHKKIDSIFVGDGVQVLVPLLPAIIMLHILKYIGTEPVYMMDDYLESGTWFMHDSGPHNISNFMTQRTPEICRTNLSAYLSLFRDSYELYNSSYMSPNQVLDEIRKNSFYEIYEDRLGTIHYRMPRYNAALIKRHCEISDKVSVSFKKSDSAVYNMTLAQNMQQFNGRSPGTVPQHYIDKLSIIRFGLRLPETVENPNALTDDFSRHLSKFMRDYTAARSSRTASITRLVDLAINPGDMVTFRSGVPGKMGSNYGVGDAAELFVGYVVGVSDSIAVSGQNTQTLELAFVRSVDLRWEILPSKSLYRFVDINTATSMLRKPSNAGASYGNQQQGIVDNINFTQKSSGNSSSFVGSKVSDYLVKVSDSDAGREHAKFRFVADPLLLAIHAGKSLPDSGKSAAARRGGKDKGLFSDQITAALNAVKNKVYAQSYSLATAVQHGRIYKKILFSLNQILNPANLINVPVGFITIRHGNDFREAIARAVREVSGSLGVVTLNISGVDEPILESVDPSVVQIGEDLIVERASRLAQPPFGKDGFVREYNRLLKPRAAHNNAATGTSLSSESTDNKDRKSAELILGFIRDMYLPYEIAVFDQENLEQDPQIQGLIADVASTKIKLDAAKKAESAAGTAPIVSSTIPSLDPGGAVSSTQPPPITVTSPDVLGQR